MACTQTANATTSSDPTDTLSLRRAFLQEMRRRFRGLRGDIRTLVGYENDALNLTSNADAPEEIATLETDSGRVHQFYIWVRQALEDDILEIATTREQRQGEHWTARYIRDAYLKGWNQATGLLFQGGASVQNYDDDNILQLPVPESQLRRLYTRAYQDLEDIAADAAETLREELTAGLAAGENPRKIADRVTDTLESIQKTRAETLARTAIIDSHSTAALDRYEDAGVNVVSHGEWATAGDERVCRICRALEGKEFTTAEMRDTTFEMGGVDFAVRLRPPAHPNGRCTILPVIGGTPPETPLEDRLPDERAPEQQAANARVVA
jgi:SPP1 gp7 family putative phage head morphogenesis protein